MNKEEILAKSREAREDEGMTAVENKGRRTGIVAFCCVEVIFLIVDFIFGNESYAPLAMFWAFISAEAYPKYRFTKKKIFLIMTIVAGLASAVNIVSYIIACMR